jgi:hypothetical protein
MNTHPQTNTMQMKRGYFISLSHIGIGNLKLSTMGLLVGL